MDIGVDISLSKVLLLASHGIIVGPTAVEVKNTVMAMRPVNSSAPERFLPMRKAAKRKSGKRRPIITTGPFI